jgi:transposase
MNFIGIDLHKQTISICVVNKERKPLEQRKMACADEEALRRFFAAQPPFQLVVEATASYEWFVKLVEPYADRIVLAHPKKLRIIAESTRKSDRIDARVLAEFLALDMIPEAYRPTPRQREHRALVRQRVHVQRRIASVKNKIRRILCNYNADVPELFTRDGLEYLAEVEVAAADRFALDQLTAHYGLFRQHLVAGDKMLRQFAESAPPAEAEARAVLDTIPGVGPLTIDVVLSELGDIRRFRSQKDVAAYAGLTPATRESAGKVKHGRITKEGSPLLRWILVEAAWRLAGKTRRWGVRYESLAAKKGKKRAIVAVARRLLETMTAMLQKGEAYRWPEKSAAKAKTTKSPKPKTKTTHKKILNPA